MKARYRKVRLGTRGGMFYCKDSRTGSRTSLETKNRQEAERLIQHKNEAEVNPAINRKIGMSYLSASDPESTERTWAHVMQDIVRGKEGPTLDRYLNGVAPSSRPWHGRILLLNHTR